MKIFKNAWFAKFAKREAIADAVLLAAIARAEDGLVDADLGGGLLKLRLAREGEGKSGGFRSIVCFKRDTRAIFAFGFAKSKTANLSPVELVALKKLAKSYFQATEIELSFLVESGQLKEIVADDEAE
jgi:hypothetical protein